MPGPARHHLLTVLGLTFGLAVIVGNTIGAGILRTPGEIAAQLSTFWPFISVWIIGAIYALLGANAIAEMGTLIPKSGGQYIFVRHALGDYAGFIVGWSDWLSTCGTTAAVSITAGEFAIFLFPQLRAVEVIALAVVAILTVVQWFGVRWGSWAQDATSLLKAVAFFFLIGACFYFGSRHPAGSSMELAREGSLMLAFVIALQAVIYTYDGWTAVIYFSEEVRDPGKNIPRAMFGGVLAVTAIYLLLNIAFLRVVTLPTIAGEKLAAAVVARHIFGHYGDKVLYSLAIIGLLSCINSSILMAPRVLFAMSRDQLFWRGAAEVNRGGTPDVSLLLSSLTAAAFIVSGRFEQVIAVLAFFFVANYTFSFFSFFVLRRREPDAPRPFRAIGHPFTTAVALASSIAFLTGAVISDTRNSAYALALLALSFPVYLLTRKRHDQLPV